MRNQYSKFKITNTANRNTFDNFLLKKNKPTNKELTKYEINTQWHLSRNISYYHLFQYIVLNIKKRHSYAPSH